MNNLLTLFTFFILINWNECFAKNNETLIPTNEVYNIQATPIYNQSDILKSVKDFVKIPVLFPSLIKGEMEKVYFAYTDLQENFHKTKPEMQYSIYIGYTPGCSAHYCTLGVVSAELKGKLSTDHTFKSEDQKMVDIEVKKVPVNLENNIKGYYTPGFAAGSYSEPKIQWYYKDVLYTIRWAGTDQNELTQMANSAISAEFGE